MSPDINNIINLIQARLQELHSEKPSSQQDNGEEIRFSVAKPSHPFSETGTPKQPSYHESSLPDWAKTILGRIGIRKDERVLPNLNASNPSFAARILIAVRDQFRGNAVPLYTAANIDRRLYSKIISDERRPVSRDTAIAFAFALHLNSKQAQELLCSAGHALSSTNDRDVVLTACLDNGLYEISKVNEILTHFALPNL